MNSEPEELTAGGVVWGVTILGSLGGWLRRWHLGGGGGGFLEGDAVGGPGLRWKLLGGGGIEGACDRLGCGWGGRLGGRLRSGIYSGCGCPWRLGSKCASVGTTEGTGLRQGPEGAVDH